MPTIKKQFPFTDQEAVAHAKFYGWKEVVVDESKLDENGNVPLVPATNADGSPRYEQVCDMDPDTLEETNCVDKLDEAGNPIQAMEPLDVYIPNPETAVDFLSKHFDEFVKDWFLKPAKAEAEHQVNVATQEAKKGSEAMLKAIEGGVKGKIGTVIE